MRLVDTKKLSEWMDGVGLERGHPLLAERITTGHSNELFLIRRGRLRLALRRPPVHPLSPTAHDMAREFRVLRALSPSDVPVPGPVVLCEDPSVIGAPFYLMEVIEGVVARHEVPIGLSGRQIAFHAIETLVRLHGFDWIGGGLEDFGRPDGYLERQTSRWLGQLDEYRVRPLPEVDEVRRWLSGHVPAEQRPGLIHGDYTLVNLMYAPAPPVRIEAVVDWEQSTIGDPLMDLGWFLGLWHQPGEPVLPGAEPGVIGFPGDPDMPSRAELLDRYGSASNRDLSNIGFYCALALFKLACIMEGSYARFLAARSDDPYFATLEEAVPALAARAMSFAG